LQRNIPLFSIITICKNSESTIEKTINSVINQTFTDFEYIIIDGCSTDSTLSIIQKYDHVITKWQSESDDGISDALNKGIKLSTGKYIGIINSDDWFEENTLKIVSSNIFCNPKFDVYCFSIKYWDDDNPVIECVSNPKKILKESSVHHSSTFVARECYENYGLYDRRYKLAMDYELFLRFFYKGCSFFVSSTIVSNRLLGGVSYNNFLEAHREVASARSKYFNVFNVFLVFGMSAMKDFVGRKIRKSRLSYLYKIYWRFQNRRN